MKKYAIIENEITKECSVGFGTNFAFYESIGMTELDVEESFDGKWYISGYAPKQPLEEVKKIKISKLKTERDIREEAPVEYKGKLWDFDIKSRDRINAAATALEINGIESITWTSYDDTSLELTVSDLKSIVATAAIRGDYLHKKYRELRNLVNMASTIEEIESITFTTE